MSTLIEIMIFAVVLYGLARYFKNRTFADMMTLVILTLLVIWGQDINHPVINMAREHTITTLFFMLPVFVITFLLFGSKAGESSRNTIVHSLAWVVIILIVLGFSFDSFCYIAIQIWTSIVIAFALDKKK